MVQVMTTNGDRCGGSIIASKFVVTAAHCVMDVEHAWILLGGGFIPHYFKESNPVKQILVHYGYNRTLLDNDIALLETWFPIDLNIYTPICLRKTPYTYDHEEAQVNVLRDGFEKNLYARVLPPSSCRHDNSKKSRLCAVIRLD